MNVLKVLKKDHATVRNLFNQFDRTGKSAFEKKLALFERIRFELTVHARAEEEIFYPALKAINGRGRTLVIVALREHREMDELLTRISRLKPESASFAEKMEALMETVDRHVEEKEREIFQFAQENCPEGQLEQLGSEIEERKKFLERQLAA